MPRTLRLVRQFSIKYLFLGTFVAALLMAFLAGEPLNVAMAAAFCVGSWLGVLVLSYLTISHLVDTIVNSIRVRKISVLTARYRWAYLDGFIALWMFFTIVISNFVLENSVANARHLIWTGWTVWMIGMVMMVGQVFWQRRSRSQDPD